MNDSKWGQNENEDISLKKSCEIRLKSWAPVFYNHYWSCFLQTIDLVLSMKEILKLLISESKVEYQMWNQKVSSVWSQLEIHRKNWRNAGAERKESVMPQISFVELFSLFHLMDGRLMHPDYYAIIMRESLCVYVCVL